MLLLEQNWTMICCSLLQNWFCPCIQQPHHYCIAEQVVDVVQFFKYWTRAANYNVSLQLPGNKVCLQLPGNKVIIRWKLCEECELSPQSVVAAIRVPGYIQIIIEAWPPWLRCSSIQLCDKNSRTLNVLFTKRWKIWDHVLAENQNEFWAVQAVASATLKATLKCSQW